MGYWLYWTLLSNKYTILMIRLNILYLLIRYWLYCTLLNLSYTILMILLNTQNIKMRYWLYCTNISYWYTILILLNSLFLLIKYWLYCTLLSDWYTYCRYCSKLSNRHIIRDETKDVPMYIEVHSDCMGRKLCSGATKFKKRYVSWILPGGWAQALGSVWESSMFLGKVEVISWSIQDALFHILPIHARAL